MLGRLQDADNTTTLAHYLRLLETAFVVSGCHSLLRHDVAMDQPMTMGFVQRIGDVHRYPDRLLEPQHTTAQSACQCLTLEALHHEEMDTVLIAGVVERTDVGVIQTRCSPGFAFESLPQFRVRRQMIGQNLDGDAAIEPGVAGAVHLAHPTSAERLNDLIGPQ
jgi:hypothetical protein